MSKEKKGVTKKRRGEAAGGRRGKCGRTHAKLTWKEKDQSNST